MHCNEMKVFTQCTPGTNPAQKTAETDLGYVGGNPSFALVLLERDFGSATALANMSWVSHR